MERFADWLSRTSLSQAIQTHGWVIPSVQSIHIAAISVVLVSAFLISLRVIGWAGADESLRQITRRFSIPLFGGLSVLLATGVLMVVGEPARELLAFSFWLKMVLVVAGTLMTAGFAARQRRRDALGDGAGIRRWPAYGFAVVTLLLWIAVVFLGRFIAYDHVWGSWSHSPKA